jgi:hypothetical protein
MRAAVSAFVVAMLLSIAGCGSATGVDEYRNRQSESAPATTGRITWDDDADELDALVTGGDPAAE